MNEKILVAMSGGVDSAVAALLLRKQGCTVEGGMLRLWKSANSDASETDAAAVAEQLGIPFAVADRQAEFRRSVIDAFIAAYERGETPNPCVLCNKSIKFTEMLREADARGMDAVATGHYARIEKGADGRYRLLRGRDASKDQSYMLYGLSQSQLARVRFPLGGLTKAEVRELAEMNGLPVAVKRDSQDICFIPDGDYAAFIERTTGKIYPEGDFCGLAGNILGRHRGLLRYTTGQRKGLGLALPAPMYVVGKDAAQNRVILGVNEDLFSAECTVGEVNPLSVPAFDVPFRAEVRVRYSHAASPATVTPLGDGRLQVRFDTPQRAITPGQAAVFYDGDLLLGGGKIKEK